jgi:glucose uptake protein GlcU
MTFAKSSWFDESHVVSDDDTWESTLLVFLGGLAVGTGDFVALVVSKNVPGAIAFPIYSGTCLVLGTSLNYIIDGSELTPSFLFSGTAVALLAIICLGWSSSQTSDQNVPSAAVIALEHLEAGEEKVKEKVKEDLLINESVEDEKERTKRMMKYILILVFFGATNSSWTVCSTLAGDDVNPNLKTLALSAGRVLVQFPVQYVYSRISGSSSLTEIIRKAFEMSSRDIKISRACGVLVGIGYWSYFNAVSHVNPAVAFAVSNCSPLVTTLVGVFLLSELRNYTNVGRIGVLTSTILFVCAIVLMSL